MTGTENSCGFFFVYLIKDKLFLCNINYLLKNDGTKMMLAEFLAIFYLYFLLVIIPRLLLFPTALIYIKNSF